MTRNLKSSFNKTLSSKFLSTQVVLGVGIGLNLFSFSCQQTKAAPGANEIDSPDFKKQVMGSAIRPESEANREKIYLGKVLSVDGANLVVENNGQPLKVELKQVTPLKVGDKIQLRGTMVGGTLLAAGVRMEIPDRDEHR